MIKLTFLTIFSLFCVSSFSFAEQKSETDALLLEIDQAYRDRLDTFQAERSLSLSKELLEKDPNNVEALWRASRAVWWIGDQSKKKKIKKELFNQGIEYAKRSTELSTSCAECHFWLGGNYGSFGEVKGILKSLAMVKPIRREMAKVNALNPALEDGGGYRILGIVNYKVPGFAGGDKKKAGEQLEKAFAFNPKNPINLYYLAEYYKVVKRRDEARKLLADLDALKDGEADWADVLNMRKKAEKLKKKLK